MPIDSLFLTKRHGHVNRLTAHNGMPIISGMDWKKLISEIAETGMTQVEIAEQAGCAQSSLSDLACGRTKEPIYRIGKKLVALHELRCCQKKQAA